MKCPSCGTELWGNITSCPVCGRQLSSVKNNSTGSQLPLSTDFPTDAFSLQLKNGEKILSEIGIARGASYSIIFRAVTESAYITIPAFVTFFDAFGSASFMNILTSIIPSIAIFTGIFALRFFMTRRARSHTRYYVTNMRVVSFRGLRYSRVREMPVSEIGHVRVSKGIKIANVLFTKSRKHTYRASRKKSQDNESYDSNAGTSLLDQSAQKTGRRVRPITFVLQDGALNLNDSRRVIFTEISKQNAEEVRKIVEGLIGGRATGKSEQNMSGASY